MKIEIQAPPSFRFVPTVLSHGWCELPPFQFDATQGVLYRLLQASTGNAIALSISSASNCVIVESADDIAPDQVKEIITIVTRCLNLHRDLEDFYNAVEAVSPERAWLRRIGAGRILVSPTCWEDLVKTLLTTNTTWSGTVRMVERICAMGDRYTDNQFLFPTPQQIATKSLENLQVAKLGYRVTALKHLADAIASGAIDVESFSTLPTSELFPLLKSLKGFGDYAAGTMMRLLGHYDYLAIDTACRDVFRRRFNAGQLATDREIRSYYQQFGLWQGLVAWFDVMQESLIWAP